MSIENQLKLEFKQKAQLLKRPHQMDKEIEQLFDTHMGKNQNLRKGLLGYKKYGRVAVIAVCLLVFSGVAYASTLLYSTYSSNVSVEASHDSQLNFTHNQMSEIRGLMNEVRQQLSPGESAYMYVAALDKIRIKGTSHGSGLIKVNNPIVYADLNQWNELVKPNFGDLKTPDLLPDGFTFIKGELAYPVGSMNLANDTKYYSLLKKKAALTDEPMVWQKAVSEDSLDDSMVKEVPRLVYLNQAQDSIEVSYIVVPKSDKAIKLSAKFSDKSTAEKVQVNEFEAYYTVNKNNLLSETDELKDISWMEESDGQTILYHVSSPSMNVTKNELLLVANHLK